MIIAAALANSLAPPRYLAGMLPRRATVDNFIAGHQPLLVGVELLHQETKTVASAATLPLPDICTVALAAAPRRVPPGMPPVPPGSPQIKSSPPATGGQSSRATSTASGTGAVTRPESGGSPSGMPGGPAPRSLRTWTCTLGWRCRSSGTRSSPSPWRSTRWCPRRPPATPSSGLAAHWTGEALLLYFAAVRGVLTKTAALQRAAELERSGPPGTRTLNLWIKSPQLCH